MLVLAYDTAEMNPPEELNRGGSEIAIWSSDPAVLSVPDTVKVRRKADAATFTVSASAVEEPVGVTVTASYGGVLQRVRVIVAPDNTPTIESLRVSPNRVPGGAMVNGIVRLTAPALDGGAVVELKRRGRNMISMPETVTVPEGNVTAFFGIETAAIHGQKERTVEIIGSHNGISASATLTIIPTLTSELFQLPIALCASLDLVPCLTRDALEFTTSAVTDYERLYSFYTPELNLLAETAASPGSDPPIAYEYIWFGGMPLAQVQTTTGDIAYYFNDHLGTPILQTDGAASVIWQPEYEPYGNIIGIHVGDDKHQPLRLPGQEDDEFSELSYSVFRWYRAGGGRYTQVDPIGFRGGDTNLFRYALGNPLTFFDPLGLDVRVCCRSVDIPIVGRFGDHCYIESNSGGNRHTWGLHAEERVVKKRRFWRDKRQTFGVPGPDDPADRAGRGEKCGPWMRDCSRCLDRELSRYPIEEYSEVQAPASGLISFGDGRNSNTFVRCIANKCDWAAQPVNPSRAKGWYQPCPSGF